MAGYEKFVDEYIDYMSRVSKGDMSALAKAQPLMAKANEAGQKISAMLRLPRDAECMKRYTGINAKMSRAAAKMSGASPKDLAKIDEANKAAAKGIDQMSCMQKCQKKSDPTAQASCMQGCL